MIPIRSCLFALLLLLNLVPGHSRQFTDDQGRTVEAELLGVNGANVVLSRNGQAAQWPIAKLSKADQVYVKAWLKKTPSKPRVSVRLWEREGIGESGRFGDRESGFEMPKNIPLLQQTEEKEKYRYYDIDVTNHSEVDARNLHLSYVIYVIDSAGSVIDYSGSQTIEQIPAGKRVTRVTEAATTVRTKTTRMTLDIGALGDVSTGTDTSRSKERFGGSWARVYSSDGELQGDSKQLHDELERLDFRFTGSTSSTFQSVPVLDSFEKLREFFESLPKPGEVPATVPKPPGSMPRPPKGLPFPPAG